MSAPLRSEEVKMICDAHPEAFGEPLETNDARRLQLLKGFIIPQLNEFDGGQWGFLVKVDQNNRVPCDIIVWRPTMEHFDIMTGIGPCWIPRGVITNYNWIFGEVESPKSIPEEIHPAPSNDHLIETVNNGITQILAAIKEVNQTLIDMRKGAEKSVPELVNKVILSLKS